jgi:gas vesicle protein GvpG
MIILDRLLMGGIGFVLDKVASAVDAEMNDEGSLREELLAAQMSLELGEMDEEEFAALEREVLARLREIREERQGATGAVSLSGGAFEVDVSFRGDENE